MFWERQGLTLNIVIVLIVSGQKNALNTEELPQLTLIPL